MGGAITLSATTIPVGGSVTGTATYPAHPGRRRCR
ncbi:MAG: hypothetical protein ACOX1T_09325 [Saccharofermentanales bacterium]